MGGHRNTFVRETFSTITSPVFSELVIILGYDPMPSLPPGILLGEGLRELNKIRPFEWVFLCVDPHWDIRDPGEVLASSTVFGTRGSLSFLGSPPTVRISRPRYV